MAFQDLFENFKSIKTSYILSLLFWYLVIYLTCMSIAQLKVTLPSTGLGKWHCTEAISLTYIIYLSCDWNSFWRSQMHHYKLHAADTYTIELTFSDWESGEIHLSLTWYALCIDYVNLKHFGANPVPTKIYRKIPFVFSRRRTGMFM